MAALTANLAKCSATALRAPEAVGTVFIVKRNSSTDITNYKRGTGGRSSFSGTVATVFGGKSLLGRLVMNRLGKVGSQVILPYRGDPMKLQGYKLLGDLGQILFHPMELRDEESIRTACKYSNVVINLIGKNFETNNYSFNDVHVDGARRIARIAKECGVEKLVHVSAMNTDNRAGVIVQGGSQFLKSKGEGEKAVREEFPEAIIIRPADFVDMNDHLLCTLLEKWRANRLWMFDMPERKWVLPLVNFGEMTTKMPILPKDVAIGIIAALNDKEAAGKTYQFVGPSAYKLSDLVNYAFDCTKQPITITNDMTSMIKKAQFREMVYKKVGFPKPKITLDRLERDGVSDVVDKNLPMLTDLGVTPDNVEEMIYWMFKGRAFLRIPESLFRKVVIPRPEYPQNLYSTLK